MNNLQDIIIKMNKLKDSFDDLKEVKSDIHTIFDSLSIKITKLKSIYQEFLQENQNNLFVFGLDSFKFQNKLIDSEYNNMRKFYNLITNRMYCDYYKLHGIVVDFITNKVDYEKVNVIVKDANKKYEKYNYLDIYKHYDFSITTCIFEDIMSYILTLMDYLKTLGLQLDSYNNKKRNGLNIHNFVYTFAYNRSLLEEQINLYINYLDFFLRLHTKYLTQFTEKITVMYNQINKDIQFEDSTVTKRKRVIKGLDSDSDRNSGSVLSDSILDEEFNNDTTQFVYEMTTNDREKLRNINNETLHLEKQHTNANNVSADTDSHADSIIKTNSIIDEDTNIKSNTNDAKNNDVKTDSLNRKEIVGNVIIKKEDDE